MKRIVSGSFVLFCVPLTGPTREKRSSRRLLQLSGAAHSCLLGQMVCRVFPCLCVWIRCSWSAAVSPLSDSASWLRTHSYLIRQLFSCWATKLRVHLFSLAGRAKRTCTKTHNSRGWFDYIPNCCCQDKFCFMFLNSYFSWQTCCPPGVIQNLVVGSYCNCS